MDRLRGSDVRSSVHDHGQGACGVPRGDRRYASTRSSQNDLASVVASKLARFCVSGRKSPDFSVGDRN